MQAKRQTIDMTNKFLVLLLPLFITMCACAQIKPCTYVIDAEIDNSTTDTENLLKDTLLKKINLIFEQTFDDSAVIMIDKKVLYQTRIKTRKFLGVSDSSFSINYSQYAKPPKISIYLTDKKACVSFYPKEGKQLAYINYHFQAGWSIELSNLTREYR
jgi:hypothetical protein